MKAILIGAALAGFALEPALAQGSDVAQGHQVALYVCSTCHVAASDQPFPPLLEQKTPSFVEIANRPGVTAASLERFIASTHWDQKTIPMSMPDVMLTAEQRRQVARYILSLKGRH